MVSALGGGVSRRWCLAMFVMLVPDGAQADHITLPGAPMNVMAEADGARAVKLTWEAPTENGGSAITGYRIDYLKDGTGKVWQQLVANTRSAATEHTDSQGLKPSKSRAYRVFAINSLGTGAVSSVAGARTEAGGMPNRITGLTASSPSRPSGSTQINLRWTAPTETGGLPITSYRIHFASTQAVLLGLDSQSPATEKADLDLDQGPDGTAEMNIIDTESAGTTYSLTGLRANQEWHFRVYAVNEAEAVSDKDSDTATAKTQMAQDPGAPVNLVAVPSGDNLINLYWNWPKNSDDSINDGGANIERFRIEVHARSWPSSNDTPTDAVIGNIEYSVANGNAVHNVTVLDLLGSNGINYAHGEIDTTTAVVNLDGKTLKYRVYTETGTGDTLRKSGSIETTAKVGDSRIEAPDVANGDNGASNNQQGKVTLTWDEPDAPEEANPPGTGYRIDYAEQPAEDQPPQWRLLSPNTNFAELPYEHKDRPAGKTYRYRVFANPGGPIGVGSAVFEGMTAVAEAPGAVTGLTGTVVNAGQITLRWKAPAKDGGSDIVGYHIHVAAEDQALPLGTVTMPTVDLSEDMPGTLNLREDDTAIIRTKDDAITYSLKSSVGREHLAGAGLRDQRGLYPQERRWFQCHRSHYTCDN